MAGRTGDAQGDASATSGITVKLVGDALYRMRQPEALAGFPALIALARRVLPEQADDPARLVQSLLLQAIAAVGQSSMRVAGRGPAYFQAILTAVYVEGQTQREAFPRFDVGSDTAFSRHLQRAEDAVARYLQSLESTRGTGDGNGGRGAGDTPERRHSAALRRPLTSFVGRDDELAILAGYLSRRDEGRPRLITLTGPPGVGKSRLAIEAAHAAQAHFAHVWTVPLAAVSGPAAVLPTIAAALPIDPALAPDPVERLRRHLAGRTVLLLLDDADRVTRAGPALVELLQDCPGLTLLITSRTQLRAEGEHVLEVLPLTSGSAPPDAATARDPVAYVLAALRPPAVRLFVDRATAADARFVVDAGNVDAIVELCRHLDGLPLAIEIVAARPGDPSSGSLARALSLDLPNRHHFSRHSSLEQAIAASYDALPPVMRRLFRSCAVFEGAFDPPAAEAVFGATALDQTRAAGLLEALADQHLVERQHDGTRVRYAMLRTLRQFGRACLEEQPEEEAAVYARLTAYYVDLVRTAEGDLFGPAQVATLARLEQELDNVRGALRHAAAISDRATRLALVGPLWMFWSLRGHVREGRAWLRRLRPRKGLDHVPEAILAKALFCGGFLAAFVNAPEPALYQRARDLFQRLRDRRWEGWCLLGLGQTAVERGEHDDARTLLLDALAIFQTVGDLPGKGWALSNLGRVALLRRVPDLARQRLTEASAVWQQVGDAWGRGTCLGFLANQEHLDGRDADAIGHYEQSIGCFADLGFHLARAWRLNALGDVLRRMGDDRAARERYEASRQLFTEQNAPEGLAWTLHNLAYPALHVGDLPRATALLQQSLTLFQKLPVRSGQMACLVGTAGIALARGDAAVSARYLGSLRRLSAATARLEPADRAEYERIVRAIRAALGPADWDRCYAEGYAAPVERALAYLQGQAGMGRAG